MKWIVFTILFIGSTVKALLHGRRVLCYLDYAAVYNDFFDLNKDLEPALHMCTHAIYLHAIVDNNTLQMVSRFPQREIDLGGYKKSVDVKKRFPHLSVMISLGGWFTKSSTFSTMAREESTRRAFIKGAVEFLKLHSFDGMELRWYFPGSLGGSPEDKENFVLLSKDLKKEFDKNGLLYGVAVPNRKRRIDEGIDGKRLAKYVHFLNVITIEYHQYSDGVVGASAPIYADDELNIDFTVQYYLKMGIDPGIMNIGLSSYFLAFMLRQPLLNVPNPANITGLSSKTLESFKGPFTKTQGLIAYFEVCTGLESMKDNVTWTITIDSATQTPFAIYKNAVVAMENEESIAAKVKYAMDHKLGGVTYFSLDKDDFDARCNSSNGEYPILRMMDKALNEYFNVFYNDIQILSRKHSAHYFWSGLKSEELE